MDKMNSWNFDISKLESFLEKYESDFKNIFSSVKNEELSSLIDLYNIEDSKIVYEDKENYLKNLKSNKNGVFLLIGGIADENVNYFRFLDGIQYRVDDGEVYEYSAENFHNYKCKEEKVHFGKINLSVEIAIGFAMEIHNDKVILYIAEIKDDYINKIDYVGDLNKILENYLKNF